jgi:hypothetical protein
MAKDHKKPAVTDPLEAAKIASKPPLPTIIPPPPPVEFKSDPDAPMEVPPPAASKKYRVTRTTTISLGGSITKLNDGDVVSESSFGPLHMKRILESGVPLEEIKG